MHFSSSLALIALSSATQALEIPSFYNMPTNVPKAPTKPNGSPAQPSEALPQGRAPPASNGPPAAGNNPPYAKPSIHPGFPNAPSQSGGCPAVWNQVSKALSGMFGQCNDDARASIRAVFHDCFADGCNGSLALPDELSRPENVPMTDTVNKLSKLAEQYNVGVADMIVFAGSQAVVTCPGGPITPTMIGRTDATEPAPPNQLPKPDNPGDASLQAFEAKGFSAVDLGALIGSHTTAKQFNTDPDRAGAPEDSTPNAWDTLYYQQTIAGDAPFTFQSDKNLLAQSQVGPVMRRFAVDKMGWDVSFAAAFAKMGLLGSNHQDMVDCTSALPRTFYGRDAKAAAVNARAL